MKTTLNFILWILFVTAKMYSQEIPKIITDKTTIEVKKLNVKVEVVGDVAITTFDMQFYNPKNRV